MSERAWGKRLFEGKSTQKAWEGSALPCPTLTFSEVSVVVWLLFLKRIINVGCEMSVLIQLCF